MFKKSFSPANIFLLTIALNIHYSQAEKLPRK